MKAGYLSEFFTGVGAKTLSAVEADPSVSRQHEFNGAKPLVAIFGEGNGKQRFDALFIYLSDSDDEPIVANGSLTWYNSRVPKPTTKKRAPEYRCYFPTNEVSTVAAAGDLLVVARRPDNSLLVVIAQGGSTIASQVRWLFGLHTEHKGFSVREELETEQDRIHFASAFILEQLGIEPDDPVVAENYLDTMLAKFGGKLPATNLFSAYARETVPELDPVTDPDAALLGWMEREEILFRTMEKHLLGDRLQKGFADDVDGFLAFSLAVQNRRKSRSGHALENHLQVIFKANRIRYERGVATEGKAKPDFLFPGSKEYKDEKYNAGLLTMLGAKTTCKDRWRQVLAEAKRIEHKHLLTLEAAISTHQTDQMQEHKLRLVIPRGLHNTFTASQQKTLLDLAGFNALVRDRERTGVALTMPDVHTPEQRSRNMAAIKRADTKPEMRVRSLLHSLGYRFRLHRKDLPGKPDIVMPKFRTVIFVHGCFWHSHDCRWGSVVPKTRREFWAEKRLGTTQRDARNLAALEAAGWRVIVIWECQSKSTEELRERLALEL